MAFHEDFFLITVFAKGLDADKPARPESKQHAYWAYDAEKLYLSDNDRQWVAISASGGGSNTALEIPITAGENLAFKDNVFLDESDGKWYKIDIDASPVLCGRVRGVCSSGSGITADATGTATLQGVVDGYTGLTNGGRIYASTIAGGYTQTKPSPTLGGSQVALVDMGFAVSTTEIMAQPHPVQYMKSATLADDGTMTINHHTDAQGRERDLRVYLASESIGASVASYSDSNQDVDMALRDASPNTYTADQCTGGTASASSQNQPVSDAFDNNDSTHWAASSDTNEWAEYDFGTPKPIRKYTVTAKDTNAINNAPKNWSLEYYDGATWQVAHTPSAQTSWSNSEKREFTVSTINSAARWRLNVIDNNGGAVIQIAEIEMMEAATYTDGDDKLAQSFEVTGAQTVKTVDLWLKKVGSPTGTMTLRVETDNTGEPSGTLADANLTTTVAESGLGASYADVTFTFSTAASISGSTTYWLVLSTDRSASETDYIEWGADGSSPSYADGEMMSFTLSGEDTISIPENMAQEGIGGIGSAQISQAQSFVPVRSGDLTELIFYMGNQSGSPSGTMTIDICSDNSDAPGSVIDSETTTPGGSGTTTTVPLGNISVTASTKYWIVWRSTSPQAGGDRWSIKANNADVYASGKSQQSDDGGTSWSDHVSTYEFRIDLTIDSVEKWIMESKDAVFEIFAEGIQYDSPALVDDWETALAVFGARYDDGSGSDGDTKTTVKNYTGVSKDVIAIVELH